VRITFFTCTYILVNVRLLLPVKLYLNALGSGHPVLIFFVFVTGFALITLTATFQTWYLGYWASQYEYHSPQDIPVLLYVHIFRFCVLRH
jgi:hypothetical protein